eukprot:scaffold504_cov189-Ochromonas_danica.AAC.19
MNPLSIASNAEANDQSSKGSSGSGRATTAKRENAKILCGGSIIKDEKIQPQQYNTTSKKNAWEETALTLDGNKWGVRRKERKVAQETAQEPMRQDGIFRG